MWRLHKCFVFRLVILRLFCLLNRGETAPSFTPPKLIMDNENEVLCEKIINDIQGVFTRDSDLSSFEIIQLDVLNQNKSPVIHEDHNLGLEEWCAKHVYDYAHKTIKALRVANKQYTNDKIIKYVNVALLINPDVTTFWNIRRQLVEKNKLKIDKEFRFSAIVLTKKPKSSEAFAYRRWLFPFQSGESIDWSFEIAICERCADKNASNYHAWSHRQWVLQKAAHLLKSEVILTEKFIKKHISDYSCYHHRQFVLHRLFEIGFYDNEEGELIYLKELINFHLISSVSTLDDIIRTMLPACNFSAIGEDKLKSFLYCCNLASYDVKFCDELKNLFGARESFENHRRASLKFIVDNCVKLNSTNEYHQQPLSKVSKYDYSQNAFLLALKKSEGMLGERHRKWCSLFLSFEYSSNSV